MKAFKYISYFMVIIVVIFSCNEIFEDDISDKALYLNTPADSTVTYNANHVFWWEYVDGASGYNLQIVTPDFLSPERILLDTVIEKNSFEFSLFPGNFQWQVIAMNNSSETYSDIYTLTILDSTLHSIDSIILLAPSNNLILQKQTLTFWWNEAAGVESYNLQIVSPDFLQPVKLILDTTINDNVCKVKMFPGEYQWRIIVDLEDNSIISQSYNLVVTDSTEITNEPVVLYFPDNNYISPVSDITFHWKPVKNALKYEIHIRQDNWINEVSSQIFETSNDSLPVQLDAGEFYWGVKAINDNSETDFSVRKLTVDTANPGLPQIVSPVNDDTINRLPVVISWLKPADNGTLLKEEVLIFNDPAFTNIVVDTITSYSPYLVNSLVDGSYFIKIKSIDLAGNEGDLSQPVKFTFINEE